MTDITKCSGEDCEDRKVCWRYMAPSSGRNQSWMVPPIDYDTQECDEWVPIRPTVSEGAQR